MICVTVTETGEVVVADPQPVEVTSCTAVLISGAESWQLGSIFQPLSTSDAIAIGSAIWLAWATAWGFRVLIRQAGSLSIDGGSSQE